MGQVDVALMAVEHPVAGMQADGHALLDLLDLPQAELSIVLCDDATIHALNREWRAVDHPTDVLSFSQVEGTDVREGPLGDVVISVDTAARQATELGHGVEHELRVLLVHGVLHLLGHDHDDPEDAAKMHASERELLSRLAPDSRATLLDREPISESS